MLVEKYIIKIIYNYKMLSKVDKPLRPFKPLKIHYVAHNFFIACMDKKNFL